MAKRDTTFIFKKNFFISEILFFLKGSTVIIAPLLFQRDATNEIFQILNFNVFELSFFSDQFLIFLLVCSFFSSIYIANKEKIRYESANDYGFFITFNFKLFFNSCFGLHNLFLFSPLIRHSISLVFELDKSFKIGFKKFIIRAIPLTSATIVIFLVAIYSLKQFLQA